MKILLVEDEKISRISLTDILTNEGNEVIPCESGTEALSLLDNNQYDVIITDLRLPGHNGMEVLKTAKEINANTFIIVMTAYATVETAIEALKLGAYDYLTKPFSPDELLNMLNHIKKLDTVIKENKELKHKIKIFEDKKIIGNSLAMKNLLKTVELVSVQDYSVLITGESGTGKEMIAKEIHNKGNRHDKPFIAVNCAAVPENLFESLFFGHEKGSFSGANNRHIGYFERSDKGTIFIDEIDDFPIELQVKLLRIIQEREIERIGGTKKIKIDTRIICATKENLNKMVDEKRFRDDLYYRLNVIPLYIPPLRERKDDIPLLIEHFLNKYKANGTIRNKIPQFINQIFSYDWPGNVRELENAILRIIAIPNLIDLDLKNKKQIKTNEVKHTKEIQDYSNVESLNNYLKNEEKKLINWALEKTKYNISNAAKLLKIPRSTLRSKIDKLEIEL